MRALADRSRNKAAVSPLFSASHDRNSKAWPFNSYIHFPKQSCMKRKWYTIFVVAAGCIALALGFILFRLKYGAWKELEIELMKDLIQLSLIIIAAGGLAHEYNLDRDDQKKLNEIVTMYQDSEPETSEVNVSGIELLDKFIFNTGHFKAKISDHHHRNIKLFLSELRRLKEVPEYPDDKSLSPDLSGASAQG